jgi:hypothetical protein
MLGKGIFGVSRSNRIRKIKGKLDIRKRIWNEVKKVF